MARISNPFAFSRIPVTIVTTVVYTVLLSLLIVVQLGLPRLPKSATPYHGINLTEAWHDLQLLTAQHHPYNSRRNDFVHDWLLQRVDTILRANNASANDAYVFNDQNSNVTSSVTGVVATAGGLSVYFEGTNIIVYIRGADDDQRDWWTREDGRPEQRNGVLVNAHYDSVSTGFGSTDDGVGVISALQLVRYYSTGGNRPRNGIVILLNNGEEDFLNGARAFGQHPMSRFVSTFLNLEGAGAGGRAALFRSTDEEVTRAYAQSPYPFGTVVSADAFERGLVRSQTDYVVFNGVFGLRGLDVAFIGPRSRYHTDQDDSRHTGKQALWHMLSAAVSTTKQLSTQKAITLKSPQNSSIWFDLLGKGFILMQTHTFFALAVALLIAGPILLFLTMVSLARADKLYIFSNSRQVHTAHGDEPISLYGWRGCFRFPLVLTLSSAAPVALAYLLTKQNPEIVHSSPWPIWAMMISACTFVAWFLARFADYLRPTALTRVYGYGWISLAWWIFLIVALVHEEQVHVKGGYFTLFMSASAFLATWLSYLELFSAPRKLKYCRDRLAQEDLTPSTTRPSSSRRDEEVLVHDEEEEITEQSSLLRKRTQAYKTVPVGGAAENEGAVDKIEAKLNIQHDEQDWSAGMWNWVWLLQFLVIAPINIIILGQLGLYLVEALHQTGQDGSSMFIVYLGMALVTILMLTPVVPLIHRVTWHVPSFMLVVLVGTLLYNLLVFPFSAQNRLTLRFQQQVDIDLGNNSVTLTGLTPYLRAATDSIPSTAGQKLVCTDLGENRETCSWSGPVPKVVDKFASLSHNSSYGSWVNYNTSIIARTRSTRTARFTIQGKNTRACKVLFDQPIVDFNIKGQGLQDKRFDKVPEGGTKALRLWSRTWNRAWTVDATWNIEEHGNNLTGRAVCLWSDVNQKGVIPAFDEVSHFVPDWVAVTKLSDGLVEAYKRFEVLG